MLELILVSVALASDVFAMLIASASYYACFTLKKKCFAVFLFAFLHSVFACVGWCLGGIIPPEIIEYFIALIFFCLFLFSIFHKEKSIEISDRPFYLEAVISSLDAFAGGITLVVTEGLFWVGVAVFSVTAVLSCSGLIIGKSLKSAPVKICDMIPSVIFFILTVKAVAEAFF